MSAPRIKIQGKTYKVPSLDDLTLDDIILLDGELRERYRSSWAEVNRFAEAAGEMTEQEAEDHPLTALMGGVTVWMVLRVAGKAEVTMKEALAIPSTAVEEIMMDGPKDRQPKKKRQPRKASAPAVALAPAVESSTSSQPQTSSKQSASA